MQTAIFKLEDGPHAGRYILAGTSPCGGDLLGISDFGNLADSPEELAEMGEVTYATLAEAERAQRLIEEAPW